jgi:cell division topological specificity factor
MNLREILEHIFPGLHERNSRQEVKNRLKLVLAHDRAAIAPDVLETMRREILEVVSRYVDLDAEEMELTLDSSDRMTILVANLPIRRVNPQLYTVKEETLTGTALPEIQLDEAKIGEPDVDHQPPASSPNPSNSAAKADIDPAAATTPNGESAETARARLEDVVYQDNDQLN